MPTPAAPSAIRLHPAVPRPARTSSPAWGCRVRAVVLVAGLAGLGGMLTASTQPASGSTLAAARVTAPAPARGTDDAPSRPFAAVYPRGAVAGDHPAASEAGASVLRAGGNAVDAAVAASFALSVVRPDSCGIGGGGFMLIHVPADGDRPAETHAIDYRETAPAAVGPDHFLDLRDAGAPADASRTGVHAVGVPGTVAGLLTAHGRFGRLSRDAVIAPAIQLAEDGWRADAHHVEAADGLERRIAASPHALPRAAWIRERLGQSGRIAVGDRLRNPEQAGALRLIAAEGIDGFYRGPIAEAIAQVMADAGGPMTAADLAAYSPRPMEPLVGTYRGRTVLTMPPPSSGGVAILQTLGILERLRAGGLDGDGPGDARRIHALVESLKHAFADRAEWMADPDFVDVPTDALVGAEYLDALARRVDPRRTLASLEYGSAAPPPMDGGTSHISVVDVDGMAVACTETINLGFGSLVPVPGFGFVLNDQMDDFTTRPGEPNAFGLIQSDRNLPAPGKRPLSSMSPTIVLGPDGAVEVVAGASGGPRIITGTLEVILHVLDFGMDAGAAVEHPRLHHQWLPDVLQFEAAWLDADGGRTAPPPVPALEARGHEVGRRDEVGNVQLIVVGRNGRHAASDPRKGGRPAGH